MNQLTHARIRGFSRDSGRIVTRHKPTATDVLRFLARSTLLKVHAFFLSVEPGGVYHTIGPQEKSRPVEPGYKAFRVISDRAETGRGVPDSLLLLAMREETGGRLERRPFLEPLQCGESGSHRKSP